MARLVRLNLRTTGASPPLRTEMPDVVADPIFTYRPELDTVRAISIIAVLLYHLGIVDGGFIGVDLFFALSGFLITGLLLAEKRRTGRISLFSFYIRRGLRLFPALGVMLAGGLIYVAVF